MIPAVNNNTVSSFALVIRNPYGTKQRGKKVDMAQIADNKFEIIAVHVNGENQGQYEGQTLNGGNIYFDVRHPKIPISYEKTHGYWECGYRHFTSWVDYDSPSHINEPDFLLKVESSLHLLSVDGDTSESEFLKRLRDLVVSDLEHRAAKLSQIAREHSIIHPHQSRYYAKDGENDHISHEIDKRIFLSMVRSNKFSCFTPKDEHSKPEEQDDTHKDDKACKAKIKVRRKDRFIHTFNGVAEPLQIDGLVFRRTDPKDTKKKKPNKTHIKTRENTERRRQDKIAINEGLSE